MSMAAACGAEGGICPFVCNQPQVYRVELMLFHGPIMVSYKVVTVTNRKWSPIISAYLPHSTIEHLLDLEEALSRFQDHIPIVLGDLSADIGQSQNPRIQEVADLLMEFGIMDLLPHFQQRWRCRHIKTCYRVRQAIAMQE